MAKIPPDAFETYAAMGPARSYDALARKFHVTKRAIGKRAAKEKWQDRLAAIEQKARERMDEKLTETMEAVNARHLKIFRMVQGKALQALQSMALTSGDAAVRALDVAVRGERLILGEPSERSAISIEDTIRREYQRWMVVEGSDEEEKDDADASSGS